MTGNPGGPITLAKSGQTGPKLMANDTGTDDNLIIEGIQCPICAKVIWQGVRRRRDAVYCSNHCRQAAYRQRIHDAQL